MKDIKGFLLVAMVLCAITALGIYINRADAAAPGFTVVNTTVPAEYAATVTLSDVTPFSTPTRGLYIGGSGTLVVKMATDSSGVTFQNLIAGTIIPVRVSYCMSTGSTASNIVALF